jgi:hypothetical protein
MTKTDAYIEFVLWNQSMDRLIRVLGRLELHLIRSRRELREYAIRLEEVRAGLNADFAETMAARERADEFRLRTWRTALEKQAKPELSWSPRQSEKWVLPYPDQSLPSPLGFLRTTYKSLISTVSSPAVFPFRLQQEKRKSSLES